MVVGLFFDLLEPWVVRELYIRKTADFPLQLCVDTFPRFVAIGFYFLSSFQRPLFVQFLSNFYRFPNVLQLQVAVQASTLFETF
jgi:hypothetical protein